MLFADVRCLLLDVRCCCLLCAVRGSLLVACCVLRCLLLVVIRLMFAGFLFVVVWRLLPLDVLCRLLFFD